MSKRFVRTAAVLVPAAILVCTPALIGCEEKKPTTPTPPKAPAPTGDSKPATPPAGTSVPSGT